MKFLFFLSPQSFPITPQCLGVAMLMGCYQAADNGPSTSDQSEDIPLQPLQFIEVLSFFSTDVCVAS